MTTASPSLHETAIVSLTLPPPSRIRDGHVARQRAANASWEPFSRSTAVGGCGPNMVSLLESLGVGCVVETAPGAFVDATSLKPCPS
jgi:hypothetical protein